MKNLLLSALFILLLSSAGFASGPDRGSTTDSVYTDGGNKWPTREVKMSTSAAVILSSAAADAGLGASSWRKRTITNLSTCSVLGLYPDDTTNTTYNYSNGLTLSSMTTTEVAVTAGNTVTIDHQGAIKGIWKDNQGAADTVATLGAKRGALVTEQYWK